MKPAGGGQRGLALLVWWAFASTYGAARVLRHSNSTKLTSLAAEKEGTISASHRADPTYPCADDSGPKLTPDELAALLKSLPSPCDIQREAQRKLDALEEEKARQKAAAPAPAPAPPTNETTATNETSEQVFIALGTAANHSRSTEKCGGPQINRKIPREEMVAVLREKYPGIDLSQPCAVERYMQREAQAELAKEDEQVKPGGTRRHIHALLHDGTSTFSE